MPTVKPFKLVPKQKLILVPAGRDVLEIISSKEGISFKLSRRAERDVLFLGQDGAFRTQAKKNSKTTSERPMSETELKYHAALFDEHAFEKFHDLRKEFFESYLSHFQNALKKTGK